MKQSASAAQLAANQFIGVLIKKLEMEFAHEILSVVKHLRSSELKYYSSAALLFYIPRPTLNIILGE